jgi:hypothetical protein
MDGPRQDAQPLVAAREAVAHEAGEGVAGRPGREQARRRYTAARSRHPYIRGDLLVPRKVSALSHQLMKAAREEARLWSTEHDVVYEQFDGFELQPLPQKMARMHVTIQWWFRTTPHMAG